MAVKKSRLRSLVAEVRDTSGLERKEQVQRVWQQMCRDKKLLRETCLIGLRHVFSTIDHVRRKRTKQEARVETLYAREREAFRPTYTAAEQERMSTVRDRLWIEFDFWVGSKQLLESTGKDLDEHLRTQEVWVAERQENMLFLRQVRAKVRTDQKVSDVWEAKELRELLRNLRRSLGAAG